MKVTTQKNQLGYEGKKKGNERGRESRGTYFCQKIFKKLFSYMATYRVLTVLPQTHVHVNSAGDILRAAPS